MSQGDVETPLGTLRCTLRAAKEVNAAFGSFGEAGRRADQIDFAAITMIVAAALGAKAKDIESDVFDNLLELRKVLGEYIGNLARGGKPVSVEGADDGKKS
jgi:hypothetical protein